VGNRQVSRPVLTRPPARDSRTLIAAGLAITLIALAVFWPVSSFKFVNYDDFEFVAENPHVSTGLGRTNIVWAFANAYAGTGGPLTWISHMLDVEMFGMDAGWHHVTSLVIHLCNSLLMLAVLSRMTGTVWRSAVVAVLFAIHPLHVESVAWVAERKDVLSTLFWLLTMWAYVSYVKRPEWRRYGAVVGWFALGLLSKPMVATLPFVLLLLDVWPLDRWKPGAGFWQEARPMAFEKLPLFALAAASMVFTMAAQQQIGAVAALEELPLPIRLSNAAVSYVAYIGKTFWPTEMRGKYWRRCGVLPAEPEHQLDDAALVVAEERGQPGVVGAGRRRVRQRSAQRSFICRRELLREPGDRRRVHVRVEVRRV
jgi:hypothetical protein